MSLNQYFRKFSRTFFKDASGTDTRQVVASGATLTVYRQGATLSAGSTITAAPTVLSVYDVGRLLVGDTVQLGANAAQQMTVTALTANTVTVTSSVGTFVAATGSRLVPYGVLPTLYNESTGTNTTANPITLNSRGLGEFYVRESLVDVIVSGTGLTTTLYQNEPTGSLHRADVRDFGAAGDGTTNDTTAIARALASVPSTGGDVYFPPGTYRITSSLTPQSKTRLHGEGSASILLDGTGNMSIVDITNVDDIEISHLALQGSGAFGVSQRGAIFSGTGGSDRVRIENVFITSAGTSGISLKDSLEVDIVGCTIRNSVEHGIFLTSTLRVAITGNTIVSSGSGASGVGIYVAGSSARVTVSGNVIDTAEVYGIRVSSVQSCVFSDNILRGCPTGILLEAASFNNVSDNQVIGAGVIGISLTSSSDQNRVTDNVITGSAGSDITIAAAVTDTQVINNSVVSFGITDAGTRTTKFGNKTTLANGYFTGQTDLNMASGQVIRVNGVQVLSSQGASAADVATAASSVTWGQTINTILARLRAHGIIAT